jgi:putative membrane protein
MDGGLTPYRRHLLVLLGLYATLWSALAIAPFDRGDWALENLLVLLFGIGLALGQRHFRFSRRSCTLIFLFLCLHAIGAHYTYSEVPYDAWFQAIAGRGLNDLLGWQRNNFDRLVHFSYGLLLACPIREIFLRVVQVRGFWGYFLPLDFTLSTSALYELLEWLAAECFGGELGAAYLGTQGDIWDAQKDMAIAALGALLAMLLAAWLNQHRRRDYAREWADGLRADRASARPAQR